MFGVFLGAACSPSTLHALRRLSPRRSVLSLLDRLERQSIRQSLALALSLFLPLFCIQRFRSPLLFLFLFETSLAEHPSVLFSWTFLAVALSLSLSVFSVCGFFVAVGERELFFLLPFARFFLQSSRDLRSTHVQSRTHLQVYRHLHVYVDLNADRSIHPACVVDLPVSV